MKPQPALGSVAGVVFALAALAQSPLIQTHGDISPVHDPAIIRQGDRWYVFATNQFNRKDVPQFCSADLKEWKFCGHVFDGVPAWALQKLPGARGIWAPDVSYAHGEYRLYYAVSTFGSNHSAIGLTTNKTLDPASPDYQWTDQGLVLESNAPAGSTDDFNAIDPNLVQASGGAMWLAFGSFWDGIKMRRIDPETGKLSSADTKLYSLATRRPSQTAIEAPFIVRNENYYYLFVSFDRCCRGKDSTYKIMVGRASEPTGPYLDRDGKPMLEGGGTLLMEGNDVWKGPGGQSIFSSPAGSSSPDVMAYHAYDGVDGRAVLHISTLTWEGGWPHPSPLATSK
jgi:arabinan endo-1,5-alpha-L-arabinosidase